jgi:hypothetical protein
LLIDESCDSCSTPTSGVPYYVDCLIGKYNNCLFSSICCQDDLCIEEVDHWGCRGNNNIGLLLDPESKRKGWYKSLWESVSCRKTKTFRKNRIFARWFDSYRISTSWQLLVWLWQPIWVSHYEWSSRCRGEFATSIQRRNPSCSCVKV